MATATFDYSTLDANKKATFKQVRRVAIHFSGADFKAIKKSDKPIWSNVNVIVALILEHHNKVVGKDLTHGEVQSMLTKKVLPKKYRTLFNPEFRKSDESVTEETNPSELDQIEQDVDKIVEDTKQILSNIAAELDSETSDDVPF